MEKPSSGKRLELFTNIYIIPPEIVEGWENSNGPFQVINAIFFPFPFPACQGGSPAPHVGHWEAAGLAKAAAQWGPAASGSSFHPRQLCGTLEGKSPAAAAQLGLGGNAEHGERGHRTRPGRQTRTLPAQREKVALEMVSTPSCIHKQPAMKDGVIPLVCLLLPGSCRAPSAAPVIRGRLPGRAPLAGTARGLGLGKAATFHSWASHTNTEPRLRGTARFSSV